VSVVGSMLFAGVQGCLFTFLKRLEAFKCDLKLIRVCKLGRVLQDVDAQKRDDGHRSSFFRDTKM
jgi:hypothetical protein